MTQKFPPHGDFQLALSGCICLIDARGPWNEEFGAEFWAQMREMIPLFDAGGVWGMIVRFRESALMAPDGFDYLKRQLSAHTRSSSRVAVALVIGPDVEGHCFVEELYRNCYEGICPSQTFETMEAANAWLAPLIERKPA